MLVIRGSAVSLTLRARTPGMAVLHGEGVRRVVDIGDGATVILEGLNVTGGSAVRDRPPPRAPACRRHGSRASASGFDCPAVRPPRLALRPRPLSLLAACPSSHALLSCGAPRPSHPGPRRKPLGLIYRTTGTGLWEEGSGSRMQART